MDDRLRRRILEMSWMLVVEEKNEAFDWRELAPELLSREVIASGEDAEDFGRHHATVAAATSTHLPAGRSVPEARFSNSAPTPSATPGPSIHSGSAGEIDRPERTRTETSLPNHTIWGMHPVAGGRGRNRQRMGKPPSIRDGIRGLPLRDPGDLTNGGAAPRA